MQDSIGYPSQELVKSLFDYKDGRLYWKIDRPRGVRKGDMAGYIDKWKSTPRYRVFVKSKLYVGARIIFLWHNGLLPEIVDHADRDTLNDHIDNLRAATKSQNQKNCKSAKNSTSKYLGVCMVKSPNWKSGFRWRASIRNKHNKSHIGYFKTEEEAALAFNSAAVKYNGEFASLNIIQI